MSHTGSVIHPNRSPGVIRMITLGFALTKNGELVFAVPPANPKELKEAHKQAKEKLEKDRKEDKKTQSKILESNPDADSDAEGWIECARERFVVVERSLNFVYGDPVRFNLELIKDQKNTIDTDELKDAIPDYWKIEWKKARERERKLSDDTNYEDGSKERSWKEAFDFKYIATEVEKLSEKFVLFPFYKFIGDMEQNTADKVLQQLRKMGLDDKFDIHPGRKVQVGGFNTNLKTTNVRTHKITSVRILDYEGFSTLYHQSGDSSCLEKDFSNNLEVWLEMEKNNQHFISTTEEIPTWQ